MVGLVYCDLLLSQETLLCLETIFLSVVLSPVAHMPFFLALS